VVDFTQYKAPGVYVEDTTRPLVTSSQQSGSLAVLIGPGRGYQSVTEVLRAYSTPASAVPFGHLGAFKDAQVGPPAIAEPVVKDASGTTLVRGSDYSFSSTGSGATIQVSITRLADDADVTDVSIASPLGVADGDYFTVSYNYADSAYYTPLVYEEFDGIANVYGEPFVTSSSAVNSPLSLAAKIAFENGAGRLMILPTDPADGTYQEQLVAAYAKVVTDYRAGMVVPLFVHGYSSNDGTDTTVSDTNDYTSLASYITDVKTHVNAATAEGYGRIAFVGAPSDYDETNGGFDDLAIAAASKRVVVIYPPKINLYNSTANETIEVSGYYIAAGLTGILAGQAVERGITRQILTSFVSLPSSIFQAMTKVFKDTLSSSGVTVVETDRLQRLTVRHGVTTNMASLDTREISLVRIADALYQAVQFGMDNSGLIGEPIDEEMPSRVKGSLVGILEQAINDDVIISWDGLQVRQQSLPGGDPTVIECKFSYKPAVPLNYITVQFQIDLQTGLLDFQDDTLGSGSEGATV